MAFGGWGAVLVMWRAGWRWRLSLCLVAVVAVGAAVLVVSRVAAGGGGLAPLSRLGAGPFTVIAQDSAVRPQWRIVAFAQNRASGRVGCLGHADPLLGSTTAPWSSCFAGDADQSMVQAVVWYGPTGFAVVGLVAADAWTVRIHFSSGQTVSRATQPVAGLQLRAFAYLPRWNVQRPDHTTELETLDASGRPLASQRWQIKLT